MTVAKTIISCCFLAAALAGCDQLGIETPDKTAARMEAEGKAIGGACRHAGRALEDCYEMNRRSSKAAIYAGWRDMDGYMRENNIAVVKPSLADDDAAPNKGSSAKSDAKPDAKSEAKADDAAAKPATDAVATKPVEDKATATHSEKAGKEAARAAVKTS